jgi:hypothetical protein
MGTWGTGPFDNDDAGDMVAGFMKPIRKVVSRKSDASARYGYNEARCAVQFVMAAHGTDILGGPSAEPALRALLRMRKDTVWLSGWKSSRKIAVRLNDEILDVVHAMTHCKGCLRAFGKKALTALEAEAMETVNAKVPRRAKRQKPRRISRARVRRSR